MAEATRDAARLGLLIREDERDRGAVPPGPAGAPGSMHVTLVIVRRIEVDHLCDVVQIEAARGDVGRHEGFDLAAVEAGESPLAGALRHVAVHCDGAHVLASQPLCEPVRTALRPREHECEPL